jgi:arylsulfatase A-like enzyme
LSTKPNVIILLADQWRAQAFGYAGNRDVKTPKIDKFAEESINFTNAVSGCPVCSPYRASLITGQYPITHGVFVNDVCLRDSENSIARSFSAAGYDTAYIGKWHLDGHGRSNYIPPERRQGFDYWKVLECTHDYNDSYYYDNDSEEKCKWNGYDAAAQTEDAVDYITSRSKKEKPFFLFLSWGPPHAPYETAPEKYKRLYENKSIDLRKNVPAEMRESSEKEISGYYAHCTALDDCFGMILDVLEKNDLNSDTIILFTSDHGDMLGSQGHRKKQRPWDESIRVPFLLKPHASFAAKLSNKSFSQPIDAPDIMPTLLDMAGIKIPPDVEGSSFSDFIKGEENTPREEAALLSCIHPFGQFSRKNHSGFEFRGLRTEKYTYVRTLDKPWLLYDNEADPYQLNNLIDAEDCSSIRNSFDKLLSEKLEKVGDEFLPSEEYLKKWDYVTDESGTVPYNV